MDIIRRNQLKAYLNELCRVRLKASPRAGHGFYECPCCGSGTGPHGTGALRVSEDGMRWRCFACGKSGDIFDLIGVLDKLQSFADRRRAVEQFAVLSANADAFTDPAEEAEQSAPADTPVMAEYAAAGMQGADQAEECPWDPDDAEAYVPAGSHDDLQNAGVAEADYGEYYQLCVRRLEETGEDGQAQAYLRGRGISKETAAQYNLGFDPEADPASAPGGQGRPRHPVPRIIIPLTADCYVARSIDPDTGPRFKALNPSGARAQIFNFDEIMKSGEGPVFITEGVFDALSIIECGQRAIALNSASNVRMLLSRLQGITCYPAFIIALDKDQAGERAAGELQKGLIGLGAMAVTVSVSGPHKDPNERLCADRDALQRAVEAAVQRTGPQPHALAGYIRYRMGDETRSLPEPVATGFAALDREIGGGLRAGLYVLAAESGMGKTTLALQIAAHAAEGGRHVLYFSLEQSVSELTRKFLTRYAYGADGVLDCSGITALNVCDALEAVGADDIVGVEEARKLNEAAKLLSVIDADQMISFTHMANYVRTYIRRNDNVRPLVIADYLQIMRMTAEPARDIRTEVNCVVTAARQLSRELGICVLMISAINRAGYMKPVDFGSIKESGGIEYTADVVWGMHLACVRDSEYDDSRPKEAQRERIHKALQDSPRRVELRCLKNRFGRAHHTVLFDYYPEQERFAETASQQHPGD